MCVYTVYIILVYVFKSILFQLVANATFLKYFELVFNLQKYIFFNYYIFSIVNDIWFTWPVVCLTTQAQAPRVFDMFDIFLKDSKLDLKEDTPTNPICTVGVTKPTVGVSNVWWVWLHIMWVWLSPQWVFQMCGGCGYT